MINEPLRREFPIERFVIRVMRDIATGSDFAHLVAIDNEKNEHTFGYSIEGEDFNLWVASPATGKVGWSPNAND